ncbi:lysophosphatidic acid receptor 3-like [Dendronephthya gigantea]|uniref:lysophosphatidic acid receptor 3-like n=1 Tax=Dendronephthya gigantea TaxID=151771 RepID=UPI00106C43C7|nr:lysophosphatidic acid receptor 3-like [Dendronephthya gigantea]
MNTMDQNSTTELNISSSGQATEICFRTYIVNRPTTAYIANSALGVLVNAILAILGTFLNALVVAVFWKTRRLRNKVSYFMIMLLSCNDICVTVIVHPLYMLNSITEMMNNSKCVYKMIYQTSAVMLSGISYLTFVAMNIERYLSICQPFFHMKHVTKKRCFILSAISWLISIGTAIAPIVGMDIQFFVTAITVLALGGVFFIYVSVYRVAKKSRNSPLRRSTTHTFESEESTRPEKTVSLFHDIQLAKMYVIVVFTTVLLNLPNAVVLVMFSGRVKAVDGVAHAKVWTLTLISMNSTFNSIIFFWANGPLRNEGWKLCKKIYNFNVRGSDTE